MKLSRVKKGIILERKVANFLYKKGYAVIRSPASGSAKKRPEPDLVVIKNGKAVGIEISFRSKKENIKILREKAERMREFIRLSGARLLLCVKYGKEKIKCIDYEYVIKFLEHNTKRYVVVPFYKIEKEGKEILEILKEILG